MFRCDPNAFCDELFGPAFENSVFICDPAHSLVHREVLEPDGVTFQTIGRPTSQRTNSWFRAIRGFVP
jgi:hypothetical protein